MFNIDWSQFVTSLLPGWLRKTRFIDYLNAALKPFIMLFLIVKNYRIAVLFKLRYTSQVIYLEHMLNAVFNEGLPAFTSGSPTGIWLGPGSIDDISQFVFRKSETETEDKWLYRKSETPPDSNFVWLYTKEEIANLQYDYTVNVPISLGDVTSNQILYNQIASWVNIYNQAGKRFKITNYTP
jgi:uncharacterized protein (DUF1919 family)